MKPSKILFINQSSHDYPRSNSLLRNYSMWNYSYTFLLKGETLTKEYFTISMINPRI